MSAGGRYRLSCHLSALPCHFAIWYNVSRRLRLRQAAQPTEQETRQKPSSGGLHSMLSSQSLQSGSISSDTARMDGGITNYKVIRLARRIRFSKFEVWHR